MHANQIETNLNTARKRPFRSAAVLFGIAGLAVLTAALLNNTADAFVRGIEVVGAVAFFVLAYLWYRRAR